MSLISSVSYSPNQGDVLFETGFPNSTLISSSGLTGTVTFSLEDDRGIDELSISFQNTNDTDNGAFTLASSVGDQFGIADGFGQLVLELTSFNVQQTEISGTISFEYFPFGLANAPLQQDDNFLVRLFPTINENLEIGDTANYQVTTTIVSPSTTTDTIIIIRPTTTNAPTTTDEPSTTILPTTTTDDSSNDDIRESLEYWQIVLSGFC